MVCALIATAFVGFGFWRSKGSRTAPQSSQQVPTNSFAAYVGSSSCQRCHPEQFDLFRNSHHALAERVIGQTNDTKFFEPARQIAHGSQRSEIKISSGGEFQLLTAGNTFRLDRVIGTDPLRQFLVSQPGGRFQVTELAVDPRRGEWFDIFGDEDRRSGEWGHWTGRGLNWNSMCAACHNTKLNKGYDAVRDTYVTRMAESGVGCEACHGPMARHVAWQREHGGNQKNDPTIKRFDRDRMLDACGSCHSRRAELTGDFEAGEHFFDHYSLTIPDETDVYYADGQVRDEDYEFASFLGSKMHAAGVRCVDCHEPHSGKTRESGDALCLRCHGAPIPPAPKIEVASHTHHPADTPGSHCVDCHMPQTTYMQRHARHDHGFIIPDPLLTQRDGIPNACNRCHSERTTEWTLAAVEKWYGAKMERFTRRRAEVIAESRSLKNVSPTNLLVLLKEEQHPFWRAVETGLLRRWAAEPKVTAALLAGTENTNALVRAMSVRAVEPSGSAQQSPPVQRALRRLLDDPCRAVRIEAAWSAHAKLDTNSVAGRELLQYLAQNADQPAGALQLGTFYFDCGENEKALDSFQKAASWDPNSAPFHYALAVALSRAGDPKEAVEEMKAACRLAPNDAEYRLKLGLALNEAGDLRAALSALEQAVKIDPQLASGWYNLALGHSAVGQAERALEELLRAESIDAGSPQYPYARATILLRLGESRQARKALERALEIEPAFVEAATLLKSLASGQSETGTP